METTTSVALNTTTADYTVFLTAPFMRYISFFIGGVGLTGNTFVVVVIVTGPKMRKQITNAYFINQSVLDAFVSLFLILTTVFEDKGRRYETFFDEILCKFWMTKMWLWSFFISSTYNLLALTLERYLSVVHPIWHKTRFSRGKVAASLAAVWIIGPAYNMSYLLPTSGVTEQGNCATLTFWPSEEWHRVYGVLAIFVQFFGPLFLLVFFYARMIVVLRRRVRVDAADRSKQTTVMDTMGRARKNILKTMAIVGCCYVFCWIWNQTYFLMFNLGSPLVDFTSAFYNFTVVMVFLNSCINPFIYVVKYEEFQKTMKSLLCRNRVDAIAVQF